MWENVLRQQSGRRCPNGVAPFDDCCCHRQPHPSAHLSWRFAESSYWMLVGLVYEACWLRSPCTAEYSPFLLDPNSCVRKPFLDNSLPIKYLDPLDLVSGRAGSWQAPRKAKLDRCSLSHQNTQSPHQAAQNFHFVDFCTLDNCTEVE